MNLTLLHYFYTVAIEGSFMAAAKKLNYAQSNLSTRIRQLEKYLGTELFIRGKNGVTLTEKGRILYQYAERILSLTDEAEKTVRQDTFASSELRIAAMESAAATFLPELFAAWHREKPQISIRVRTGTTAESVRNVLEEKADLAFVAGRNEHEDLNAVPVRKEKLVLAANTDNLGEATFHQLLKFPLLVFPEGCSYRRILQQILAEEGIAQLQVMEYSSLSALLASASAGLGICLFPESAIHAFTAGKMLTCYEVPEKFRTVEIYVVYRKKAENNRTLMDFLNIIQRRKNHE